jgi:single-strand DNA-binding protein
MSSLNSVTLCGRLGRDVECRFLPSGDPVANFSLATSEQWTGKDNQKHESVQWHQVEIFGRLAEIARDFCVKGGQVLIVGQLVYDEWQAADGTKKTKAKVKLSGPRAQLVLLGGKGDKGSRRTEAEPEHPSGAVPGDFQVDDSDLPF